jgi:hypothetical protein
MKVRLPFFWVKDPDTLGDLFYDLAREEKMLEELENPGDGPQPR